MSQSLARVWLHLVFSTKDRRAFLQHDRLRDEMCRMPGYHINEIGCHAWRAGAWIDHVHLVCGPSRTVTIAALVEHVKVETSKWAKNSPHGSSLFSWQSGDGAFSVSFVGRVEYPEHAIGIMSTCAGAFRRLHGTLLDRMLHVGHVMRGFGSFPMPRRC